jgi:hypothetical protein
MLQAIDDGLWLVASTQPLGPGLVFPNRMTVMGLGDGALLLYSPVPLAEDDAQAIEALGEVRHLVAPSTFHHLHLGAAKVRFPKATTYGPRGLERKCAAPLDVLLGPGERCDLAPGVRGFVLGGMPKLNEIAFVHRPSRTLVVCDLVFNMTSPGALMRLVVWLSGVGARFGVSRLLASHVKDRAAFAASMSAILDEGFERVVMCHGDVVASGGRALLRDALTRRFGKALALA